MKKDSYGMKSLRKKEIKSLKNWLFFVWEHFFNLLEKAEEKRFWFEHRQKTKSPHVSYVTFD